MWGVSNKHCSLTFFIRPKKSILDSQAPPHCPQSPGITDFFLQKKKKKKISIKNISLFRVGLGIDSLMWFSAGIQVSHLSDIIMEFEGPFFKKIT